MNETDSMQWITSKQSPEQIIQFSQKLHFACDICWSCLSSSKKGLLQLLQHLPKFRKPTSSIPTHPVCIFFGLRFGFKSRETLTLT